MLFFKLYNWLKYKTTPSSFLFKNRLFIERDSKHRKVMNNFGLTFRNSKWSNYENNNVNPDFRILYLAYFLRTLAVIFFFFYFFSLFFENNFFFNSISFFFWLTVDSLDYYASFMLWSFLSFMSVSFTKLFLIILDYRSSLLNKNSSNYFKKEDIISDHSFSNSSVLVSKHDLNWFMYSWLKDVTSDNKYSSYCAELLFDSNVSKNQWESSYDFFFNLNLSSFFLNLNNKDFYFYKSLFKDLTDNRSKNIFFFFDNIDLTKTRIDSIFSFNFKSKINNFSNLFLIKDANFINSKWNLDNTFFNESGYTYVDQIKQGSFYISNFTFNNFIKNTKLDNNVNLLFKNLIFSEAMNSFFDFGKWNRWLYRYSLLHRKSVKFGQKLIFTKRILNPGFYNSSIFKKNIWNSNLFNVKNLNSSHMTTFFDIYFNDYNTLPFFNKNFINNSTTNTIFSDRTSFLSFKFLESSYFWYLKRFFLYNSMKNNNSFFKVKLNSDTKPYLFKNKFDSFFDFFYLNLFFKNRTFSLQTINNAEQFSSSINSFSHKSNTNSSFDKSNDVFMSSFDIDVFSKENLMFLSTLSSNPLNAYLFKHVNNFEFYESNVFLNNKHVKNLNLFWSKIFFNHLLISKSDFFFFKDLFIFFELYNK